MIRTTFLRAAIAAAATLALPAAHATEGGGSVVPIGVQTVASGSLQPAGDYLLTYNTWVRGQELADGNGDSSVPDFHLRVQAHAVRYLHVFDGTTIWGGTPAFEVAVARVNTSISSAYFGGRDTGIGDTSLGPSLGWHGQTLQQMVSALVVVPTGSYDSTRTVNVGRNTYALQLDYAVTAFTQFGLEASAMNKIVINRRNMADGYKSGTELDIDYALNQHLPYDLFVGVGGYLHRQFTDDKVDGATYDNGHRVRDFAIGPQAGWGTPTHGIYVAWQHQTEVRNAAKGDLLWVNGFFRF